MKQDLNMIIKADASSIDLQDLMAFYGNYLYTIQINRNIWWLTSIDSQQVKFGPL